MSKTFREMLSSLTEEGWWTWEDTPSVLILTNGEGEYWKLSRSGITENHAETVLSPDTVLYLSPNYLYLLSTRPDYPELVHKTSPL